MDHHTVQIQFQDLKQCSNRGSVVRITKSGGVSQVAFILAAIASISLISPSSVEYNVFSSTLFAHLHALGSFLMSKKALFVLSNAIFLFLAADYYRCFFSLSPSTGDCTACGHSGDQDKQEQHRQVGVEPSFSTESCVPDHSEFPYRDNDDASEDCSHGERRDGEVSRRNVRTPNDEMPSGEQKAHEDIAIPSQPEFFRLDKEANSVILESVVVKEPSCGTTAQELDELGIDELNKKFEEFIKSRKTKWEKEEASLS
uniref:Uncharacterized protein n=1 Tax=Oryza punctata TaxID=4537 RepID=A0A0E0KG14_ORYPU